MPWVVAPLDGKYYGTEVLGSDGKTIAEIWVHSRDLRPGEPRVSSRERARLKRPEETEDEFNAMLDEYLCDTHYERQADYDVARLIAAAPDLLAALKAVISVADRKTNEFDLAHAAIAKVEQVMD